MKSFIPYPNVNEQTGEELWYYLDEHGSVVGPFESEESALGAAGPARKVWRRNQENDLSM